MPKGGAKTYINCLHCHDRFHPPRLAQKFCSISCKAEHQKMTPSKKLGKKYPHLQRAAVKTCLVCKSKFRSVKDTKARKQLYCSKQCWSNRGLKYRFNCVHCGEPNATSDHRKKFCNRKCSASYHVGENAPAYKDGKSLERERARCSYDLSLWRKKVYKRDNHQCRLCNDRSTTGHRVTLNAHHIKPFSEFIELRLVVDNGLTVCEKCHYIIHEKNLPDKYEAVDPGYCDVIVTRYCGLMGIDADKVFETGISE